MNMNGREVRKNRRRDLKQGKEWFGKRPLSHKSVSRNSGMKFWKRLLHKKERSQGKEDCFK